MKSLIFYTVIIGMTIGLGACTLLDRGNDGSEEEQLIRTDRDRYIAQPRELIEAPPARYRYRFDIIATLKNTTDHTIYLTNCSSNTYPNSGFRIVPTASESDSSFSFVYIVGGRLQQTTCFDDGPPAVAVEAGSVRIDTVEVWSSPLVKNTKEPPEALEGAFQLIYDGGTCLEEDSRHRVDPDCSFSPSERPRSNIFEVRIEK